MKNLNDFLYDFLMIHKISYFKLRVSTGSVENRWLGGSFLIVYRKKCWQAGFWLYQCVLRKSLAGSKKRFRCPGTTL